MSQMPADPSFPGSGSELRGREQPGVGTSGSEAFSANSSTRLDDDCRDRSAAAVMGPGGWTPGHCAALAASLEVAIPKPGNVHRGADFADMDLYDFLVAAQILGTVIDRPDGMPPGERMLAAVRQTRLWTGNNPNLGIVLLLVPLALQARAGGPLTTVGMSEWLAGLDVSDGAAVFEAIRTAAPGGLGAAPDQDVRTTVAPELLAAMRSAQDRDFVARQYATGFADVIGTLVPWLQRETGHWQSLVKGMLVTQVRWLAEAGDSLIERKCGPGYTDEVRRRAGLCQEQLVHGWEPFEAALGDLDFWMRSDGNRRNPGATADLLAAALFCVLWQDRAGEPESLRELSSLWKLKGTSR